MGHNDEGNTKTMMQHHGNNSADSIELHGHILQLGLVTPVLNNTFTVSHDILKKTISTKTVVWPLLCNFPIFQLVPIIIFLMLMKFPSKGIRDFGV